MSKPIALVGLLLLIVFGVDYLISTLFTFAESLLKDDLSSLQTKQIEIYVEMITELLTLATVAFAGAGLYLKEKTEDKKLSSRGRSILIATMLLAAFSIYMAYLSYDKMTWMLSKNFLNLDTPILYWLRTLQFWSFISSITLFGWVWLTE